MSFHNKPNYQIPELIEALKAHRLPHDTPSQLADSFRIGWMACRELARADSAPAAGIPPLQNLDGSDEQIWEAIFNWKTATPGADAIRKANKVENAIIGTMRACVDADRAARAPADSVLEDAARLDFLIEQRAYVVSDPDTCTGHWLHWARPDGSTRVQCDEHPTPRAAIDTARKEGGAA